MLPMMRNIDDIFTIYGQVILTTNQNKTLTKLARAIDNETVVCLTGPYGSGKRLIVDHYLERVSKDKEVLTLDINQLIPNGTISIFELRNNLGRISALTKEYDLVYIKDFERALKITTNYRFRLSVDSINIWLDFLNGLTTKTILTCGVSNGRSLISANIWMVEFKVVEQDRIDLINHYTKLNKEDYNKAISYSKGNILEDIYIGIKRANQLYAEEPEIEWSQHYINVLMLMETAYIDPSKVVKPEQNIDMVGLEEAVKIIENEVIKPIELNNPLIPTCRGVLFYGAPGTGKTTICRWLTHRLKGKVFNVDPEDGESFASSLKKVIDRASINTPAVIIIDEIDMNDRNKRAILTCMDGLTCFDQQRITIIATTMDISQICESYIRGKRFERVIKFEYPTIETIKLILTSRFQTAIDGLKDKHPNISERLTRCIEPRNINTMAMLINGQSPATIHYCVDVVIRKSSVFNDDKDEYDPIDTFNQIAKEVKEIRDQTCRVIINDGEGERNLYS
jgi:AAA+ superfamily predicted ATPase